MIAVLGSGGHGRDIADIARACGHQVRFHDDNPYAGHPPTSEAGRYVIGVNNPSTKRQLAVGDQAVTLVHPTATVAPTALLGHGVVVGAGSHIGPYTVLGDHVHVGAGCTVTRTGIGAWTTVAPGVNIAGDCDIGEECLIGVGVSVRNLITVGDRVTVGAGAVVVDDVANDVTVAGVPARVLT